MKYILIFNGREDKFEVLDQVKSQISGLDIDYEIYITTDIGDATRYVNIFCDLNPKIEVCFVACGGAGLTNEVMSGLVNRDNKYLAILAFGGTNDFVKYYPDRSFQSLKALINGEISKVDVIKINDNYALNVVSIGMDAMACVLAQLASYNGDKDPYMKGIRQAVIAYRINRLDIKLDGESIGVKYIQSGQIANGKYTGGEFLCAPNAVNDDGWLDINIFKIMSLFVFIKILKYFRVGEHITNDFCKRFLITKRAKHIEIRSKDLIYVGTDGEVFGSSSIDIDVLEKAINLIIPEK